MFLKDFAHPHNLHQADAIHHPDSEGRELIKFMESAPLQKLGSISQIHSITSYQSIITESKKTWISLPDSVNGTLIYFLLVENNGRSLSLWEFFQGLIYIGFPVFFTFYLQALLLFTLWSFIPSFSDDDNLCATNCFVQQAVISIFLIFLIPSGISIIRETLCIMFSDRVAFPNEDDEDKVVVYRLVNPEVKKVLTYCLIVVPETIILMSLFYVGTGFILTSEDIGDIIINSVAIAFIMDIDNFCVDAFQTDGVSERTDQTKFESAWPKTEEKFADGELRPLDSEIIGTFSNFNKIIFVFIAAIFVVGTIRTNYC